MSPVCCNFLSYITYAAIGQAAKTVLEGGTDELSA